VNAASNVLWQRVFRTRAEDHVPHLVTHQRIYIVPTRRGWAFLFALLLMLVAAINYALSLGYALCFLLTGLFAATLLHTYRNLAGVQVRRIEAGDCFAGETLVFTLTLANARAQVRHGIRISAADNACRRVLLQPEQDTVIPLCVPADVRGRRLLGRLTLQSDWPLGLWTCWSYLHVPSHGLVFPRPESNPPPLPSIHQAHSDQRARAASQGDVSGLRDYVPGDSIGSIAWKSAARGLDLQVRIFDTESGPSQATLSLQHTGMSQMEEQLSRLCAWVLLAEDKHTDYSLQLPAEQLAASHGKEQRQRALRALAVHGTNS
jgi:uncharacterized protein (DUF58 family)